MTNMSMMQSPSLLLLLLSLLRLLSSPTLAQQTSCPAEYNLTRFNDPQPSQNATHLDIDFTCIYNDFATEGTTYTFVPAPFVRVEPGEAIAVYSTPPDIYDVVDRVDGDGTAVVSLAHNRVSEQPGQTSLVITWPAAQLERLSVGTINGTLLLAEGFTNLRELNVTGRLGGLEAVLSTEGAIRVRMTGENIVGKHVRASEDTQLEVYVEMGEGNVEITAEAPNSITGEVHAVRNTRRTGSVSLVGIQSIVSTGQGPGQLFVDDCSKVDGNCNALNDTSSLQSPNPDCRLTDACLVTATTFTLPARACQLGPVPSENGVPSCDVATNPAGTAPLAKNTRIAYGLSFLVSLALLSFRWV